MNRIVRTSCISDLAHEKNRLQKVVKSYDAQISAYTKFRTNANRELANINAALKSVQETGEEI